MCGGVDLVRTQQVRGAGGRNLFQNRLLENTLQIQIAVCLVSYVKEKCNTVILAKHKQAGCQTRNSLAVTKEERLICLRFVNRNALRSTLCKKKRIALHCAKYCYFALKCSALSRLTGTKHKLVASIIFPQ